MLTREGGGAYTVTSRRGVKIKVRNGVARSLNEVKRKYINKKGFISEIKINSNICRWWGNKIDNKKIRHYSIIYCILVYYISVR